MSQLKTALETAQKAVDQELDTIISAQNGEKTHLIEAIRYATFNGGKRIRPFMCLSISELLNVPQKYAVKVAAAIELLHSYSLIHDDLPAMDDSDLRRGKPSCHIQFDEATAILAGDAMLAFAFEILSDPETHPDPEVRCKLVNLLAKAGGPQGMALGQMMDIEWDGQSLDLDQIKRLQDLKTGLLIEFSCLAPAIMAGSDKKTYDQIRSFAHKTGFLYQVADDLLDVEGNCKILGKPTQQDDQKSTFVSLLGLEGARKYAEDLSQSAQQDLDALSLENSQIVVLKHATQFILKRAL